MTINEKDFNDYFAKLPKVVKDFIADDVWQIRIDEICKKYSLSAEQKNTLSELAVVFLIGLEKPENLLDVLVADLGITKLLAEQIVDDLDKRVFEYAVNYIDDQEKKKPTVNYAPSPTTPKPVSSVPPQTKSAQVISKVPEIKPNNLPMVEKNPPAQVVFTPKKDFKPAVEPQKQQPPTQNSSAKIVYKPEQAKVEMKVPEPVQKPVSVPRFVGTKMEEEINEIMKPLEANSMPKAPTPQPIPKPIPDVPKINYSPVPNPAPIPKVEIPKKIETTPATEPKTAPTHNYVVDPYREPLE